jgi:thiamine pyridinylase
VVLYPAIPNFPAVKDWVVKSFEKAHPDVHLEIVDLTNNYYGSFVDDYIGCADADVYELDSVFLYDFALNGRIQALPETAKAPSNTFLKNAVSGVVIDGTQYGAPHWVCENFLFFQASDKKLKHLETIDKLSSEIGPHPPTGKGIAVDLKGKSTLGEFYLNAVVDRYQDWNVVKMHIAVFDAAIEKDLARLRDLCEGTACRDSKKHSTPFFAEEFETKKARALIGYSESLNGALKAAGDKSKCPTDRSCLHDADFDVDQLPLDSNASKAMSWVDSFTINSKCTDACLSDAAAFIQFMNQDDTFMAILVGADGVPTYLLPAKASLYANKDLVGKAHLYPALKAIIENAVVPSDLGLNEELRNTGRTVDKELSKP